MTTIELVDVRNYILKNISLKIDSKTTYIIIGPNGAGKTTLLKTIAGLVDYKGTILFNGEPVDHIPPYKRSIGYLPQSNALFPHMSVEENILFGLLARGYSRSEAYRITHHVIDSIGLSDLRKKYPLKLSGGEKKLVALARALAIDPDILLLDEPLTGLHYDYCTRVLEVVKEFGRDKTVVLVTHSVDEALWIGEHICVLDNGVVKYSGAIEEFMRSIDKYLWYINSIECTIDGYVENLLVRLKCNSINLYVPIDMIGSAKANLNSIVHVVIPYDKVFLSKNPFHPSINSFKGVIEDVNRDYVVVRISDSIKLKTLGYRLSISNGDYVYVKIGLKYMYIF